MTTIKSITGEVLYVSDIQNLKVALEDAAYKGIDLHKADLRCAILASVNLRYAKFAGAKLTDADLQCAKLTEANLEGANLSGTTLAFASLRYANLKDAKTHYTSLAGADLTHASLAGVELTNTAVQLATFRPHDLAGATINGHTIISAAKFGPLGSRNDNLLAVQTVDGLFFQAGCFFGTKEELLAAVESTHGDSRHGQDYKLAVEFLETYLKDRNED